MKIRKILIVATLLIITVIIKAATYYAAPWGDDGNPGTFDSPWGTWQKGFETINAGDTLYIRGGIYYPTPAYDNNIIYISPYVTTPVGHDGEEGNPICIFNYPGETPILDCKNVDIVSRTFNTAIFISRWNYIHFKGLTIRNVYQPNSFNPAVAFGASMCSNITYENITVYNIGGRGFWHFAGFGVSPEEGGNIETDYDTTRWINCDAYNCCDSLGGDPYNAADGWKIQNYPGSVFVLEGCRAWNVSDDGFNPSGSMVCIFNNCWSFFNGWYDAEKCEGNGFKTGAILDSSDINFVTITQCLAACNTGQGFMDVDYTGYYRSNTLYYNNTAYRCTSGYTGSSRQSTGWPRTSTYINNIVYLSHGIDPGSGGHYELQLSYVKYPESHNNWDWKEEGWPYWKYTDTVKVTNDDFVSLDSTQLDNARQEDGSLPEITFLRLAEGSDLIDAGTDVGLPFLGNAPDLGAFERK